MRKLITFIIILIAFLSLFRFYTRYKAYAAPIPPGVYLAGLNLSTLKESEEIRAHLERIYAEPIPVFYADTRLLLRPQEIGFQLDIEQMIWEAGQYLDGTDFIEIALREALGMDHRRRDIEPRYLLNQEKLRVWLENVAAEQNRQPQLARALPPSDKWSSGEAAEISNPQLPTNFVGAFARDWLWSAGAPGYELNIDASMPVVVEALTNLEDRSADLVLIETPPASPTMADLAVALDSYLSNFPGFAAVYVHDLTDRTEAHVDDDVSFSGMSTLKIAIVAAVMQKLDWENADTDVTYEIGQWMDFALGESNNYAANLLVRWLGNGDTGAGARNFTEFMRQLGYINTFMQSGYDAQTQLAQIPTPGNQREDWNTNPDTNLQSTPLEMGRILSDIYDCSQGNGLLIETFGGDITADECVSILFYLSHDQFQELTWAGVPRPNETWFLHKHGFAFESHSDVAIVWGPTGPYVLSVFLYRAGWMDWGTSNTAMKDVSRITWNFFEFQAQQTEREMGEPLELTPPPNYVPVNNFVPASG